MGLFGTTKSRAIAQASANTETCIGRVTRVYSDAQGNVTAADVRIDGLPNDIKRIVNSSGLKLGNGNRVTVNWINGSRAAPQITGVSGASASTAIANAAAGVTSALYGSTADSTNLSGIPLLLEGPDSSVDAGYVIGPGANIAIESVDPDPDGGSSASPNGLLTITAAPLVLTALPDPDTAGLPAGTVADLIDSYGESKGLFRLDLFGETLIWRRREAPATRLQTDSGADIDLLIVPEANLTLLSPGVYQLTSI